MARVNLKTFTMQTSVESRYKFSLMHHSGVFSTGAKGALAPVILGQSVTFTAL